jgi:hypothetical protein
LVADLRTLVTGPSTGAAVAQSTPFLAAVSGVHRVVIVAKSVDTGDVDWFMVEKGGPEVTVASFPADFRHSNPGQGLPDVTNLPLADSDEEDNRPVSWFVTRTPITLAPAQTRFIGFTTQETLRIIGVAQWPESSGGSVDISVIDAQGAVQRALDPRGILNPGKILPGADPTA